MPRFLVLAFLLLLGLRSPASAQAAAGLPPRPVPFTFVTDQANLLAPTDAKKLESGLRHYADANGTQVVVVTVPSLNGASAADYGRQLGTAWGVGQRGKNNGIVVLISGKEHKMSIEAGSGLQSAITPELTSRVMNQEMAPAFKQGNYFAGLRKGLSSLMLAANPSSDPRKNKPAAPTDAATTGNMAAGTTSASSANLASETSAPTPTGATNPVTPMASEPASSGLGLGSLLIGALVIGGGIWLVSKLFRRSSAASGGQAPNFMGNGPASQAPNFMGNNPGGYPQGPGNYGGQVPNSGGGLGSGMGGILATGAAAAAGAYLGNRMAEGHDSAASAPHNFDAGTAGAAGLGGAVPPANAASDYFSSRNGGDAADSAGPDYFSDNNTADTSGDYFSNDSGSYDDTSSDDTGGGGFDSTDDNSGSW